MSEKRAVSHAGRSGDADLIVYLGRRLWWLIALCTLGLPIIVWRSLASTAPAVTNETSRISATPPVRPPLKTSDAPVAGDLQKKLDAVLDKRQLPGARWGVYALNLRDGRVVAAHSAQELLAPASNFKVYTTAAALDLLGADYRWRTAVYAATAPTDGVIAGDITLYGCGAPDLATPQLTQMAAQLARNGVRRVRGDVVGDETCLRAEPLGDGWLWNDVQWYFGAEISALTINDNEIALNAQPGQASLQPATDYVHVTNTIKSGGRVAALGINRGLSDNEIRVWGQTPAGDGLRARLAVHQPALWAAGIFRQQLAAQGITVEGKTRANDALVTDDAQRFAPNSATELASVTSATLGDIVRQTNKESINLYAELILRTLGKEKSDLAPPPAPDKLDEAHHDKRGLAVLRIWLRNKGIDATTLELHDGSGLSRLDLVTPEATARTLAAVAQTPAATVFRESLPIAGTDGTLRGRLKSLTGRVRAKTGTLTHADALSGHILTDGGETLAFAVICNNTDTPAASHAVIDEIVGLLAEYRNR